MEKKFFRENIEVPEIVQKKAEEAFSQIRAERAAEIEAKKRRSRRGFGMLAACLAVMLLFAGGPLLFGGKEAAGYFVLTARAAELETGVPSILKKGSASMGTMESGSGYYTVNVQLWCRGENIDTVSYDVSRGFFQLVKKKSDDFVKTGTALNGKNPAQVGGGKGYETLHYQNFTVDYKDMGKDCEAWINLADDSVRLPGGLETYEKACMDAISDTKLTCTVKYKDGTVEQSVLQFQAEEDAEGYLCISLEAKEAPQKK